MIQMAKTSSGWAWLARHPLRAEIIQYVKTGEGFEALDTLTDEEVERVGTNRLVYAAWQDAHDLYAAGGPRPSYREVARKASVSHERARQTVQVYDQPESLGASPVHRHLRLIALAQKAVTREVVKRWRKGQLSSKDVAALISPKANAEHALYWLHKKAEEFSL